MKPGRENVKRKVRVSRCLLASLCATLQADTWHVGSPKDLGQVFTPPWVVSTILDEVGFTPARITETVKALEPSFGQGVFLYEMVNRIVCWGEQRNVTKSELSTVVDSIVCGVEYDEALYTATKTRLIEWATVTHGLSLKLPNLHCGDALDHTAVGVYDYVVGNPPYIRVHNMDARLRQKIKPYQHSIGTTDLYIIFFELGLRWLKPAGTLGYITPNSWLRNASQRAFRGELAGRRIVKKIINFGTTQVFPDASTYTCVTILELPSVEKFTYTHRGAGDSFTVTLPTEQLQSGDFDEFVFASGEDTRFLHRLRAEGPRPLKTVYTVQNGVATLADNVFVLPPETVTSYGIESGALKPVIKLSQFKGDPPEKFIIFPYLVRDGKVVGMNERDVEREYPNLHAYLLEHKPLLSGRSLDRNASWFWYGRSQALQATFKEKLVFSPILGPGQNRVNAWIVPAGVVVYSGLFITAKPSSPPLTDCKTVIEHPDFCRYVRIVGKDMRGGYKNVSSKTVANYPTRISS